MPTYNYRCNTCSHEFERVQRITEDAIKVCPSCNADTAARLITSGNFILRGSGWYSDAYSGGSNKKSEAKGESAASSSSESAGACGAAACATGCAGGSTTTN